MTFDPSVWYNYMEDAQYEIVCEFAPEEICIGTDWETEGVATWQVS